MSKQIFTFLFIFFLATGIFSCNKKPKPIDQKELVKEMANIDKALIPALYLTSINKQFSSLEAMSALTPKVDHFIQKYKNTNPQDPKWERDLDNIKNHLKYANEHVRKNLLKQANIQDLEPLNETLIQMRARNGIDRYIPDYLYRLHSATLSLSKSLSGEIPKDDYEMIINSTKKMFASVRENFEELKSTNLDNTLYHVAPVKRKYLMQVYQQADKSFRKAEAALTAMNKDSISAAYLQLPKHFTEAYLVFGDFESLQKKSK